MNTFSFFIAFSAVLCGAFANPGHYYGGHSGSWNNHGQASVRAWEEPAAPCEGSSGARVHVSTSSDYSSNLNNAGALSSLNNAGAFTTLNNAGGLSTLNNAGGLSTLNNAGAFSSLNNAGSYGGADIATSINAGAPCPPVRTTYQQHPGFNQQNERGEIIIHRPAPIIVKRPPTKVLVNHPPLVVKPAPVVLHRPPPMVVKPVLVRHHPQPVKVEPVYVKVMKPATSEKYLLEDRHNAGCGGDDGASYTNYGHNAAVSAVDTGCH